VLEPELTKLDMTWWNLSGLQEILQGVYLNIYLQAKSGIFYALIRPDGIQQ